MHKMDLYANENSEYLQKNPTWHVEHADYKAKLVLDMITKHHLASDAEARFQVVDVGCGGGGVLDIVLTKMGNTVYGSGYDLAPDAIRMAQTRENERLHFFVGDVFEIEETFDLLLACDVFEHVPDYYGFLEKCRDKATYKFFIIPLDFNLPNLITNRFSTLYKKAGHIHFFNEDTALLTLRNCGYEIIDYTYNIAGLDFWKYQSTSLATKLLSIPRIICYRISPSLTLRFLGGGSLVVLAK